jgi:hypothetical protein
MDISDPQKGVTVYGRVAFALCLADLALDALVSEPSYPWAKKALREAEIWLAAGLVDGLTFSGFIYDTNETGILTYEMQAQEQVIKDAYGCLVSVLGYVARHAYVRSGDKPDEMATEFVEDAIQDALDYAQALPTFDYVRVQRVYDYIVIHCRIETGSEWGTPIYLQDLMKRADALGY